MKMKIIAGAAAFGLTLWMSAAASAQCMTLGPGADMIKPGCLYGGAEGDVKYQLLPDYETTIFVNATSQPIYSYDTISAIAGGGEGIIGYVFPNGTLPPWMGENFRIEFAGGYRAGSKNHSAGNNLAGPPSTYVLLDGSSTGYGIGTQQQGSLDIDFNQWQLRLTAKSDFPVGPAFILTPSITVFGGRSDFEYLELNRVTGAVSFADAILDEDVDTDQIGVRFGGEITYEATQVLRLFLGGYVGFAYMSSDYSGQNCTGIVNTPLADCGSPGTLPQFTRTATDSDSDVAFIGGVYAGARYSFGWMIVTIAGEVDYNSAVPGIRHATLANPTPAGLKSSGEFAFAGKLEIRVPFP